ncbi:MAG: site-specific DNA-methyltransferase [Elusimicrobiota bacterium]
MPKTDALKKEAADGSRQSTDSNKGTPQRSKSMAKIEVTKTELVWPGKYNEDGTLKEVPRVNLPFQVIETVNESRATREVTKEQGPTLFDIWDGNEGVTFEAGWKNKLIWGDNLLVMGSLREKFAGKIDLIYIDPPFATGADFSFTTEIGESGYEVEKEQSAIEEKAYRDTWGRGADSYIHMIYERLVLMRELLSDTGCLYVHCDWRVSHHMRVVLEDVFGASFLNEIVWRRSTSHSDANKFGQVHDSIFLFSKGAEYTWNTQFRPYSQEYIDRYFRFKDPDGRRFWKEDATGAGAGPARRFGNREIAPPPGRHWRWKQETIDEYWKKERFVLTKSGKPEFKRYLDEQEGEPIPDVWDDVKRINMMADERLGYDTQKPEALLDRIIRASSNKGALVADFFCGSGTMLAVAEKLGRRWIGCDLGRWGVHVTRKRLLGIENCKPFEVLNLGKYERQYWQGVTFGESKSRSLGERAIYEYLAFILKLYGAQPVAGMTHLHGKKGRAMIHIGAVDAPVTISEIDAAVDECAKLKQPELHVLGWEWEMGLYDLMVEAAKKKGVKLLLLQIPREVMEQQAAAKGDVRFFELAYLEAEIKKPKKLAAQVALKDFVIPNTELIPEEVRSKVKKWSDYIDYWAVDWDFRNDTFMQGWVAYRTRQERKLPLVSDVHAYETAGKRRILVKVIDIFGNDTSQAFDVEVR